MLKAEIKRLQMEKALDGVGLNLLARILHKHQLTRLIRTGQLNFEYVEIYYCLACGKERK